MQKQMQRRDLTEVKRYIENHYKESITLEQLANSTGLTATYLSSLFKQAYQVTPTEYITRLRIQKAKQLIDEKKLRVKEAAIEVGYQDEFYFSRVFKKLEGISPSQYIAKQQLKVAVLTSSLLGYIHAIDQLPQAAPIHAKWTPYYYNAWLGNPIQLLPYTIQEEGGLQLEHLLGCQPDLLIAPNKRSELSQSITMHFPVYWLDDTNDCFQELMILAKHMGKEENAKRWLNNYHQRFKEVCTQLDWNNTNPRVLVVRIYQQQLYAYSNIGIAHLLYNQLGAVSSYALNNSSGQLKPQYNDVITQQQLLQMDIDYLFVITCPEDQSRITWHQLQRVIREQKDALYQQMYVIHSDPWFEYSPVAQLRMLEELAVMVT